VKPYNEQVLGRPATLFTKPGQTIKWSWTDSQNSGSVPNQSVDVFADDSDSNIFEDSEKCAAGYWKDKLVVTWHTQCDTWWVYSSL